MPFSSRALWYGSWVLELQDPALSPRPCRPLRPPALHPAVLPGRAEPPHALVWALPSPGIFKGPQLPSLGIFKGPNLDWVIVAGRKARGSLRPMVPLESGLEAWVC